GTRHALLRRLQPRAAVRKHRAAPDACAAACGSAALLDLAPVGPAPAARRQPAQGPRPRAFRTRAARARRLTVALRVMKPPRPLRSLPPKETRSSLRAAGQALR